ncbi:MAG: ABC transporter permease subunit [Clostridiales bacterium]|nr:ABC transporter permease subunit [Clostridiales bacterium]
MAQNKEKIWHKLLKWAVVAAIWIAAWQLLCSFVGHEVLLPSPMRTFTRLLELMGEVSFYRAIGETCLRVVTGFLIGALLGLMLGVGCSFSYYVKAVFSPFIAVVRSTPFASFIILALLWLKTGYVPVLTAAIMTTPIVYEGICQGIGGVDKGMLDMARLYDYRPYDTVRYIWVPQVKPYFVAGAASSLGLSFKAAVAAEVIANPQYAIGAMLSDAKVYLETADLFAVTAALIIMSVLIEKALRRLVK